MLLRSSSQDLVGGETAQAHYLDAAVPSGVNHVGESRLRGLRTVLEARSSCDTGFQVRVTRKIVGQPIEARTTEVADVSCDGDQEAGWRSVVTAPAELVQVRGYSLRPMGVRSRGLWTTVQRRPECGVRHQVRRRQLDTSADRAAGDDRGRAKEFRRRGGEPGVFFCRTGEEHQLNFTWPLTAAERGVFALTSVLRGRGWQEAGTSVSGLIAAVPAMSWLRMTCAGADCGAAAFRCGTRVQR